MAIKQRRQPGLTLIETIVYLAIFGIVFVAIVQFALGISEFNRLNVYRQQLDRNAILVLQHLESEFNQSKTIVTNNSQFDTDNGVLELTNLTNDTVSYSLSAGQIMVQRGSAAAVSLTPSAELTVQKFRLTPLLNAGSYIGVHWEIELVSKGDTALTRSITSTNMLP